MNIYDLDLHEHCCFKCGNKSKFEIKQPYNGNAIISRGDVPQIEPIYIEKNKVELEYECERCLCKNKIVIKL